MKVDSTVWLIYDRPANLQQGFNAIANLICSSRLIRHDNNTLIIDLRGSFTPLSIPEEALTGLIGLIL